MLRDDKAGVRTYTPGVPALRRLLLTHHHLVLVLAIAALCLKLLMPSGFMPVLQDGTITVAVCSGTGAATMTVTIPGLADHDTTPDENAGSAMPCAFAGHASPWLSATDPVVLAGAIAFVVASGIANAAAVLAGPPNRLRPPLRGPPSPA